LKPPRRKTFVLNNNSHATAPGRRRRASIQGYIDRERARTGTLPSINDVARLFAMSPARVAMHYRALGLL
jgi:hypothetical protein